MPRPSDLFLSPDLTETQAHAYLRSLGFRDAAAADGHLQRMADDLVAREALGRLAPDLIPALLESPDPDAAVAAMAAYVGARSGRGMLLDYLREDPRALHVMTYVMGASPQLAEILVRTPEYFHWLVAQIERSAPDRQDHEEELVSAFSTLDDPADALSLLRRWKRRETLRIGTRYLLRHETVRTASAQLSDVASVAIDFALAIVMRQQLDEAGSTRPPGPFAVIATGRLGGREMSYTPDVDLLYVYDAPAAGGDVPADAREFFVRLGCDLTAALRDETPDGLLYRVALPAWPQIDRGLKACSLNEYAEHYSASANVRERLALTRARPIAGDAELGARFIAVCQRSLYREDGREAGLPLAGLSDRDRGTDPWTVESLTQVLQLRHGARHAALRHAGTLDAIDALRHAGLIGEDLCRELDHAHVFLESAEHRRQLGVPEDLQKQVDASRERVRELCASIRRLAAW